MIKVVGALMSVCGCFLLHARFTAGEVNLFVSITNVKDKVREMGWQGVTFYHIKGIMDH